jgi:hypothetical protein
MTEDIENKVEEKAGVRELLEKISKQQDELATTKKVKKWKLPFKGKLSKAQVSKNFATYLTIKDNKEVDFVKVPIQDGTVEIDGFPRIATADYCLTYKGKPFYILPYWSMKPFSPVENYAETEKEQMNMSGRRLVLAKLKNDIIKPKGKGFGSMGWIILVVVIAAAGYYLIQGGKLF